jgi:hypothetical protein
MKNQMKKASVKIEIPSVPQSAEKKKTEQKENHT